MTAVRCMYGRRLTRLAAQIKKGTIYRAPTGKEMSLGLCGRRGLRARRLGPAEGVEIGPDMLDGLLVEGLDRGLPALRGIDFQLHFAAFRIHSLRRIHVDTFVGGIFHLSRPVS